MQLFKQLSAPVLSRTAILESGEDILLGQNSQTSSRSSSSSLCPSQTYSHDAEEEYGGNSKFMRVEPNMDLLLGELNNALSLNLDGNNSHNNTGSGDIKGKRDIFQSQKSATSVIDEARALRGALHQQTPAWFNRSCPDFSYNPRSSACSSSSGSMKSNGNSNMSSMLNQVQAIEEEEEESLEEQFSYPNVYADWHHSTPNLFASVEEVQFMDHNDSSYSSSPSNPTTLFKTRPNLAMLSPKKKSQSMRHLNVGQGNSFSMYHSPSKGFRGRVSHEDIVLSPIGDGNTDDLFDRLQRINEFSDRGEGDQMDPMKVPF